MKSKETDHIFLNSSSSPKVTYVNIQLSTLPHPFQSRVKIYTLLQLAVFIEQKSYPFKFIYKDVIHLKTSMIFYCINALIQPFPSWWALGLFLAYAVPLLLLNNKLIKSESVG